jgi:hypothetical protein
MAIVRNSQSPDVTKLAAEDLSGAQFHFVKLDDNESVSLCDTITDKAYGVLQNAPASGEKAVIRVEGESKIVASAALAVNAYIATATDGEAQAAVSTQFPRGMVTQASAADQDLLVAELFFSGAALA